MSHKPPIRITTLGDPRSVTRPVDTFTEMFFRHEHPSEIEIIKRPLIKKKQKA